jgi:hypothetical protein
MAPPGHADTTPSMRLIAEPLMVAFAVIVDHELPQGTPQVLLTKRDEAVQAFLFDRPNKPLRMRIGVSSRLHRERAVKHKPSG